MRDVATEFHGHHAAVLRVGFVSGFDSVPNYYFSVFKLKQVPERGKDEEENYE